MGSYIWVSVSKERSGIGAPSVQLSLHSPDSVSTEATAPAAASEDPWQVGKSVGLHLHIHAEAVSSASKEHQVLVDQARRVAEIGENEFNVIRAKSVAKFPLDI
jgi:hypothetical protein